MSKILQRAAFLRTGDLIMIFVFLLISAAGFALRPENQDGSNVVITVNHQIVHDFSLMADRVLTVQGERGPVSIRIESGKVWIESSDCPHRYCVREGSIHKKGEILVCLPNRLVVRVEGAGASELDGITE